MADKSTQVVLPRGVELAWASRADRGRAPRVALSVLRVIEAAVEIADADGLGAVSMARVATWLGVGTMSLYRHVTSKDELFALMVDYSYGEAPALDSHLVEWRVALFEWSRTFRAVFDRHPWMLEVPVNGPPLEPGQLSWLELGLDSLRETKLLPKQKLSIVVLLSGYVRGHAELTVNVAGAMASTAMASSTPDGEYVGYPQLLASIVDSTTFPVLTEMLSDGAFDGDDDEFEFGLDRIFDGIAELISAVA